MLHTTALRGASAICKVIASPERSGKNGGFRAFDTDTESWRRSGRDCTEAYRDRRRHGRVLVLVDVSPRHLAALERLALLNADERDKRCIARAIGRFLDAAPYVSALGDALWPESERADG